jgi:hypothetical protein
MGICFVVSTLLFFAKFVAIQGEEESKNWSFYHTVSFRNTKLIGGLTSNMPIDKDKRTMEKMTHDVFLDNNLLSSRGDLFGTLENLYFEGGRYTLRFPLSFMSHVEAAFDLIYLQHGIGKAEFIYLPFGEIE